MTKPECLLYKNYLTVDAQLEFDELVQFGMDSDLAITILEEEYGESIYSPLEDVCNNGT